MGSAAAPAAVRRALAPNTVARDHTAGDAAVRRSFRRRRAGASWSTAISPVGVTIVSSCGRILQQLRHVAERLEKIVQTNLALFGVLFLLNRCPRRISSPAFTTPTLRLCSLFC